MAKSEVPSVRGELRSRPRLVVAEPVVDGKLDDRALLGEDVLPVRRVIRSACRRRDVEDFAVRSLGSRMRPGRLGRLSPRQEVVFDVLVGFRR